MTNIPNEPTTDAPPEGPADTAKRLAALEKSVAELQSSVSQLQWLLGTHSPTFNCNAPYVQPIEGANVSV